MKDEMFDVVEVGVREDGPAAWGAQIRIPAGAMWRHGTEGEFQKAGREMEAWITLTGSVIDMIYEDESGRMVRERYIGVDMDE